MLPNRGNADQLENALSMMDSDNRYFAYAPIAWDALSSGQREVLNQLLHQGPVWDGNIISKSARDDLIEAGLATRCCFLGEQGYTTATYKAFTVFKAGRAEPFPRKPGSVG
jgi:hypothetical protein